MKEHFDNCIQYYFFSKKEIYFEVFQQSHSKNFYDIVIALLHSKY